MSASAMIKSLNGSNEQSLPHKGDKQKQAADLILHADNVNA
jgi:hypothetical protein